MKSVTKRRGRPPIHIEAMTPAERQSRHRELSRRRSMKAPPGYRKARAKPQREEHTFTWAPRAFGFEWGTFVDGAYMSTECVIKIAATPAGERRDFIAWARSKKKVYAYALIDSYMRELRVTLEELIPNRDQQRQQRERFARFALDRAIEEERPSRT